MLPFDMLESNQEEISDLHRINTLLQRLKKQNALLTITIPQANQSYMSTVVEIDSENRRVIIDELFPVEGNRLCKEGVVISVNAVLSGSKLNFKSQVIDAGMKDGITFYRVEFPEVISYFQRRTSFRASVSRSEHVTVEVVLHNGVKIRGTIADVSVEGVGAVFPADTDFKLNQILPKCVIFLEGKPSVSSAMEVRFIGSGAKDKQVRIGGRFVNMSPDQERKLEKLVREIERAAIRKRMK